MNFKNRILPAERANIVSQEDYFIWCGSAVKDDKGKYHLFASRWHKKYTFASWLTQSCIVRFESDKAEGPYEFKEELTELKSQSWSSKMVHNPTVKRIGNKYYLFYVGTTYSDDVPEIPKANSETGEKYRINLHPARFNQRIGVAVAKTPCGPWEPSANNPILSPREKGHWDSSFTTNPSVFVKDSGEVQLIYKSMLETTSTNENVLILGMAKAFAPEGPYERVGPSPIFNYDVEDPFIWKENETFWMLVKDMKGKIVEKYNGVLFTSSDAINWKIAENKEAYDHNILYSDNSVEHYDYVERPQLLIVDGKPICLFNAVGDNTTFSFNLVRKIKS